MISSLRSIFWKLTHPGQLTEEETAATDAAKRLVAQLESRGTVRPATPRRDNVTLSRAELVTLLGQAMRIGDPTSYSSESLLEARIAKSLYHGASVYWANAAEKLLDASLARRAR